EVLDLRMACLGQRLGGVKALTDVLLNAEAGVIENAANAAGALPSLEACADVEMLRSVVQPPSDRKARERVDAIRADLAKARALGDAGQCTPAVAAAAVALRAAKEVGYAPLEAEAYYVSGRAGNFCGDAAAAIEALEEATFAAETSRHDEIAVEASSFVALLYADRLRDNKSARRWLRYGDAILRRLPDHPLFEAQSLMGWGVVYQIEGKDAEAVREQQRALALKEQALGPRHPDTAISAMNVGLALHELGRDVDAEPYAARAVDTFESVLGPESAQGAMALLDYGEVLTALGRYGDARKALDRAVAIWKKNDASPFFIAYGRFDLARVALGEKQPAEARALLEGAPEILGKQDRPAGAQARFLLARAMWETPRDRSRATVAARDARQELATARGPAAKIAEVDAWLQSHASP
ncbi:MAG TPA: tetratricopeptide repeat protein, partial [Polyangia bacterium]|nr:tetratricopeptide repeat protein [Polyangia bacterium]